MPGLGQGQGDPNTQPSSHGLTGGSRGFLMISFSWIPRPSRGMTSKELIQRPYKMMSIVKPHLLRRGEFIEISRLPSS